MHSIWMTIISGGKKQHNHMLFTRRKEIEVYVTEELDFKKKTVKEIFKAAIKKDDKRLHQMRTKSNKKKSLRALAWVSRYLYQIVILTH